MRIFVLFFLLTVWACASAAPATNDATVIIWTPPTERVDNTPITTAEIGGYFLYWRALSAAYTDIDRIQIQSGTQTSLPASYISDLGLADGDYELGMTTYDTNGTEGPRGVLPAVILGGKLQRTIPNNTIKSPSGMVVQ